MITLNALLNWSVQWAREAACRAEDAIVYVFLALILRVYAVKDENGTIKSGSASRRVNVQAPAAANMDLSGTMTLANARGTIGAPRLTGVLMGWYGNRTNVSVSVSEIIRVLNIGLVTDAQGGIERSANASRSRKMISVQ